MLLSVSMYFNTRMMTRGNADLRFFLKTMCRAIYEILNSGLILSIHGHAIFGGEGLERVLSWVDGLVLIGGFQM